MIKQTLVIGSRLVSVFSPDDCKDCPILYTFLQEDRMQPLADSLGDAKIILAVIDQVNWNNELSPWPAPAAFRTEGDFEGGADSFLEELTGIIVPAVEKSLGFVPRFRALAGYSLAGLFAVYALYRTDVFNRAASISGSLWYDGFLEFMKDNRPLQIPEQVYFSLGDRERITKNPRLAKVEECTFEAERLLQSSGIKTIFEMNPGSHFADITERITRGIKWIIE